MVDTIKKFTALILLLLSVFPLVSQEVKIPVDEEPTVVRIGWDNGDYRGYLYEFLQSIAKIAGLKYEYVEGAIPELSEKIENGEIDMLCGVTKNSGVKNVFYSKRTIGPLFHQIVSRPNDIRYARKKFDAMNGATVALMNGPGEAELFHRIEELFGIKVLLSYYDTSEDTLYALRTGEADLAFITNYQDSDGFDIIVELYPDEMLVAVTEQKPELMKRIDFALDSIILDDVFYVYGLYRRHFSSPRRKNVALTPREETFARNLAPLNVYMRTDKDVFSMYKRGVFSGFIPRLFKELSDQTGLKFNFVAVSSNYQMLDAVRSDKNAIASFVMDDYNWAMDNNMILTENIIDYPLVLITQKKQSSIYSVAYRDSGYLTSERVRGFTYDMIPYSSDAAALRAVKSGRIDAFMTDSYTSQKLLSVRRNADVLLSSIVNGTECGISFGVSDLAPPMLVSVITKGLRNISETEKNNILQECIVDAANPSVMSVLRNYYWPIILIILVFSMMVVVILMQRSYNRKLRLADKNKDFFLANMSHDFRTPLGAIKGFAYLGETENNTSYYQQIQSSAVYLEELVNDLLNVHQYANGKQLELHMTPTTPVEIAESIKNVVMPRAEAKNITIKRSAHCSYSYIRTDATRIRQMFVNLINNAIKYSPEGSEVLWKINDRIDDGVVWVYADIEDHGAGMSSEFIKYHLFRPFARESNDFSMKEGGSGLGLTITKMIVERLGGSISVKSKLGEGSAFHLEFPVEALTKEEYDKERRENCESVNYDTFDFAACHVLVCEDNEINTFIVKNVLEKKGFIVETAENGKVGIEMFKNSKPGYYDVILMDIRMPVMGGLEATRAIRLLPRMDATTIPIIALSANAFAEDKASSIEAGMNGHLSKPIDVTELFSMLATVMLKN